MSSGTKIDPMASSYQVFRTKLGCAPIGQFDGAIARGGIVAEYEASSAIEECRGGGGR